MNNERLKTVDDDCRDIERRLMLFGKAIECNLSITDRVLEQLSSESVAQPGTGALQGSHSGSLTRRGSLKTLQKLSVGALAATVLLALLSTVADSRLTFAQVVDSMQKATSCSYDIRMGMRNSETFHVPELTGKFYWQAPDQFRSEDYLLQNDGVPDSLSKEINIFSRSEKGIALNTKEKTYSETLPFGGRMSPLMALQNLSDFEAAASKNLGSRVINGIPCTGFELAMEVVDPDSGDGGKLEAWIDNHTRLPQQVSISMFDSFIPVDLVFENFQWNEPLDEELFSVVPPTGYSLRKVEANQKRSHEEIVGGIVDAFRLYAELSGGQYPQVKVIYGDVMLDDLYRFAGISLEQYMAAINKDNELIVKDKELWDKYSRISESTRDWAELNAIMSHDASALYNGMTVAPTDKEKVLFNWRRVDGKDQVIYGDLRVEVQSP
ncbi:MAG: hypothetical protein KDB03_04595 [Planctomycetales bacterium]|nr:hypothetical protein [Planctomycetales bacterium]